VTDPRKILLEQMAILRRSLDPKVLDRARLAAQAQEPYDKEAARTVIRTFLTAKSRADGGAFQRRLMESLKTGVIVDAESPPPTAAPAKRWIGPSDPRTQATLAKPGPKRR
jgi:hypothetical protein